MRSTHAIAALMLLLPQLAAAGHTSRSTVVSEGEEFLNIGLSTCDGTDEDCLHDNLLHDNYNVGNCSHHSSDIYWHENFLNGSFAAVGWYGMPYSFGGTGTPDSNEQAKFDSCKAIGNHSCHYEGNGNDASWAGGGDCSCLVCYAGGIPRVGTWALGNDPSVGVQIPWDNVKEGSYLNRWCNGCNNHVVLVKSRSGGSITIIELTGAYPVAQDPSALLSYYEANGYLAYDFKDVANAEGSDGILIARLRGDGVGLLYRVESAAGLRWIEFQIYDEATGVWQRIEIQEYRGPGDYECSYSGAGAGTGVFRVLDHEQRGTRVPQSETMAIAVGNQGGRP